MPSKYYKYIRRLCSMSSVLGRGEAYKVIQCTRRDTSKPCVGMRNPISLQRDSWTVFPGKMIRSCKNLGKLTMFNSLNIFSFHRVVKNLSFSSKLSQSIFNLCWEGSQNCHGYMFSWEPCVAEHGLSGGTGMNLSDFSPSKAVWWLHIGTIKLPWLSQGQSSFQSIHM